MEKSMAGNSGSDEQMIHSLKPVLTPTTRSNLPAIITHCLWSTDSLTFHHLALHTQLKRSSGRSVTPDYRPHQLIPTQMPLFVLFSGSLILFLPPKPLLTSVPCLPFPISFFSFFFFLIIVIVILLLFRGVILCST